MNFISKLITGIVILLWIYLNLKYIFPFLIKFTGGFNSIISIIIILSVFLFLIKMNFTIGREYHQSLVLKFGYYEAKEMGNILLALSYLLVIYFIFGTWNRSLYLGWEVFGCKIFNKIIFTIFCLFMTSIPSQIRGPV